MYLASRKLPEPESESDWDSESEAVTVSQLPNGDQCSTSGEFDSDVGEFDVDVTPNKGQGQGYHSRQSLPAESETKQDSSVKNTSSSSYPNPQPRYSHSPQTLSNSSTNHVKQSRPANSMDRFTFSDNGDHRDDQQGDFDSDHSNENPPHDFSDALREPRVKQKFQPPVKSRKSGKYQQDPDDGLQGQTRLTPEVFEHPESEEQPLKQIPHPVQRKRVENRQKHSQQVSDFHHTQQAKDVEGQVTASNIFLNQKEAAELADKDTLVLDMVKESNGGWRQPVTFSKPSDNNNNDSSNRARNIYPFDQGQLDYFSSPAEKTDAILPQVADQAEKYFRRGAQEFFAILRLPVNLMFVFLVELVLFLARDINAYIIQILSVLGDHLFKPLLSTLFNGFVQPMWIFLWNVLIGLRRTSGPIIDILKELVQPLVSVIRAFRLVEVNPLQKPKTSFDTKNDYALPAQGLHEL